MKKLIAIVLVCLLATSAFSFSASAIGGKDYYAMQLSHKVGTAPANSYLSVNIETASEVVDGVEYAVSVSVDNISVVGGATVLAFNLYYDIESLVPVLTVTDGAVDSKIFKAVPSNEWNDNVTKLDTTKGMIKVFIANTEDITKTASGSGKLRVVVNFKVIGSVGYTGVWVPSSSVKAYNADLDGFSGTGDYSVMTKNESKVIESLGAKVNTDSGALRFGARYTASKKPVGAFIHDLGILLCPKKYMQESDLLTLGYVNPHTDVKKVTAVGIENFTEGLSFGDYQQITFYVTIVGVPERGRNTLINARPYVSYGETADYGEMISRSFNYVIANS